MATESRYFPRSAPPVFWQTTAGGTLVEIIVAGYITGYKGDGMLTNTAKSVRLRTTEAGFGNGALHDLRFSASSRIAI